MKSGRRTGVPILGTLTESAQLHILTERDFMGIHLIATGTDSVVVVLASFMLFTAAVWLVQHFFFSLTLKKLPVLTPTMTPTALDPAPMVSVILPARNEEHNIRRCLHTLLGQDYPNLEIIVIDDRSEDRTADIVEEYARRDARVILIHNSELLEGWTGKNHAIHVGLQHAHGTYLLFVDADTWHHPRAVSETVLYTLREKVDMFTLAGGYHLGSFWEKVLQPVIMAFMGFCVRLWQVNDPNSKAAFAAGHYIFISRKAYEEVGGHAALSDHLLEDFAMASAVKQRGLTLRVVYAPWLMRVRMYRDFKELNQGWTRIFCGSIYHSPLRLWGGSVEIAIFGLLPWLVLIGALSGVVLGKNTAGVWTLVISSALAVAVQKSVLVRSFPFGKTSRLYVLMLFPAILILLGMWMVAIYRLYAAHRVVWKDTAYSLDSRIRSSPGSIDAVPIIGTKSAQETSVQSGQKTTDRK